MVNVHEYCKCRPNFFRVSTKDLSIVNYIFGLHMTQFEIERRSCGQSMKIFRFFSCGGQNTFTCCHSFFDVPCKKLTKKNGKNVQNQSS